MGDGARCHYCRKVPCICPPARPESAELAALQELECVAREIHKTDLAALEELKGFGVKPSDGNSKLTTALGVALQNLEAARKAGERRAARPTHPFTLSELDLLLHAMERLGANLGGSSRFHSEREDSLILILKRYRDAMRSAESSPA